MFDFYLDLPAWLRSVLATVVLLAGIGMTLGGYADRPQYTRTPQPNGTELVILTGGHQGSAAAMKTGLVITVVGVVLLMACGKTDSEKHGYNF